MSAALVLKVVWAREEQLVAAPVRRIAPKKEKPAAEMAFYRKYTEGMLRRYLRLSLQAGKTPSLLGQELFRARVTHYTMRNFEDAVIFVHDVERCLEKLDTTDQMLVGRIAIQEYTQGEVAGMTGMSLRNVHRRYHDAVDRLTAIFLATRLLEPMKL